MIARVRSIEVEPLTLELTEPFGIASGAQPVLRNVIVRVICDDGTTGLGECAPFPAVSGETQESTISALERAIPALLGEPVDAHVARAAALARLLPEAPAARAGLEIAAHDAFARTFGAPLYTLFGGARARVETDMTVTTGDVAHARASAKAIRGRGITTLKIKVGGASVEEDAERVAAAASELDPSERRIVLDANGGCSAAQAMALVTALDAKNIAIELFEQPVASDDLQGLIEVTRNLRLRAKPVLVCADESARSVRDVIALIKADACDAINLKVQKSGVRESLAMFAVARAAGMRLMMGGMVESVVGMTFSAHIAHGLGEIDFIDLDTPMFIEESPFLGGMQYRGAEIVLDESPGLGIVWMRGAPEDRDVLADQVPEDCVTCGRCCYSNAPNYVPVSPASLARMGETSRGFVRFDGDEAFMHMVGGHCVALQVDAERGRFTCAIYENRPDVCRAFTRGTAICAHERGNKQEQPEIQLIELRRRSAAPKNW
jgi:L-Ala-D/L-Glu epimerase